MVDLEPQFQIRYTASRGKVSSGLSVNKTEVPCALGFAIVSIGLTLGQRNGMAKRKINFQGQEVWGEEVEFETEREGFNSYILHDGTRLKMKTVVAEVLRLDIHKPDGEPIYVINSQNMVSAIIPENLKKKPGGESQ